MNTILFLSLQSLNLELLSERTKDRVKLIYRLRLKTSSTLKIPPFFTYTSHSSVSL